MAAEAQADSRRQAYLGKAREELLELERRGVITAGNAFPQVLLVKGIPNEAERESPDALLAGADGKALRASLARLGYAPEAWAGMLSCDAAGGALEPELFRLAVTTIDPDTLVLCDEAAADVARNAYADDLVLLEDLSQAMLAPGVTARIRGMRVMNLGGFEAALADAHQKQVMWARLKRLPPRKEPY